MLTIKENIEDESPIGMESCPSLELRGYQKQVVEEALQRNTLAVLPTGSGKTLIATRVIQERLIDLRAARAAAGPKKLIAFLAPTKILVGQQLKYICDHSDAKAIDFTGETSTIEGKSINYWNKNGWSNVFKETEVIVMTPQIMKQMLQRKFFRPDAFDLVVIDECHHALGFNPITYICQSIKESSVQPLILAITASPLTSRKGSIVAQITQLEENLNCKLMCNEEILEEYRRFQPVASLAIFEYEPDQKLSLERLVTSPDLLSQSLKDFLAFQKPVSLDGSSSILMLYAYLRVRHTAMIANVYNFVNSMHLEMDEIPDFRDACFPTHEFYKIYRKKGEYSHDCNTMLGMCRPPLPHVMRSTVTSKSSCSCVELTQSLAQILRITEECGILSGLYAFMQCIRVKKLERRNTSNGKPSSSIYTSASVGKGKRMEFTNMFDMEKFDTMGAELRKSPFNLVELFHAEYMTSVSIIDFFVAFASALGPRVCKLAAFAYLKKHSRQEHSRSTCTVKLTDTMTTCFVPKIHAVFYCLLQSVVKGGVGLQFSSEGSLLLLEAAWKEHVLEEESEDVEDYEEGMVIDYHFSMKSFYLREIECRNAARSAAWFLLSSIPLESLRDWSQFEGYNCISSSVSPFNILAEDMKAASISSQKRPIDLWQPIWFSKPVKFPIISNKLKALSKIWNILADESPTNETSVNNIPEALELVMNSTALSHVEDGPTPLLSKAHCDIPINENNISKPENEENAFIVFCRVRLVAISIHFVLSMMIENIFDNELAPLEDFIDLSSFDPHRCEVQTILDGIVDNVVCREEGIEKMISKTELVKPPTFRPMHIVGRCNQSIQLKTLQHFKAGNYNIVFATDVMEEGLDVRACKYVINFDLPGTLKSFVQRRGRSRADNSLMISMIPHGDEGSRLLDDLSYLVRQEQEVELHTKSKNKSIVSKSLNIHRPAPAELSCLEISTTFESGLFELMNRTQKLLDFDGGTDMFDSFLCGSSTKQIPFEESDSDDDPDLIALAKTATAKYGSGAFCLTNLNDDIDGYEGLDDDEDFEDSGGEFDENGSGDETARNRVGSALAIFKKKSDHFLPGSTPPHPKRRRFSPKFGSCSPPACMNNLDDIPLQTRFAPSYLMTDSSKDPFCFYDDQGERDLQRNGGSRQSNSGPKYVVSSTGAEADMRSSSQILQRFCGQLPHDSFFTPRPIFWMAKLPTDPQRRNTNAYQCSILLPPYVSQKIRFIVGPIAYSKNNAKGLAALECVKLLHQYGELTDWLLITGSREAEKMELKSFEQDQAEYKRARKKKLSTVLSDDIMAEIHQKDYLRNNKDLVDQNGDPIEVDSIGIDVKVTPDLITLPCEAEEISMIRNENANTDENLQKGSKLYLYVIQAEYGDIRSEEVLHKCPSCKLFFKGGNSFGICFSQKLPLDLIEDSFRCFIREREAIDVTVDFLECRIVSDLELLHMQRFHRGMYCWEVDAATKQISQTFFAYRDGWIDPYYDLTNLHRNLIESCKPIPHDEWRASGNGAWYVLFPLPIDLTERQEMICSSCSILATSGQPKAQLLVNSMLNDSDSIYTNKKKWISFLTKTADEAQILANNLKRQEVINYEYAADFTFEPEVVPSHDKCYGMVLSRGSGGVYVVLDPFEPYNEPNPTYDADGNTVFIKRLNDISKYVEKFETEDDIIRKKVSRVLQRIVNTVWVNASTNVLGDNPGTEDDMLDIFTHSRSYRTGQRDAEDHIKVNSTNGDSKRDTLQRPAEASPALKKRKVDVIFPDFNELSFRSDVHCSDVDVSSSTLIGCYKRFSVNKLDPTEEENDNDEDLKALQVAKADDPSDQNGTSLGGGEDGLPLPLSCRSRSKRKLEQLLKDKKLEDLAIVTFKELFKRRYPLHVDLIESLAADPNHRLFRVVTIVNKLTLHCLFTKTPKMTKEVFLSVASASGIRKPVMLHTHSNPLYLLPEFCRPIGKAKHYMTGLMAPSIVWKIIGLVHADEARNEIASIIYGFSALTVDGSNAESPATSGKFEMKSESSTNTNSLHSTEQHNHDDDDTFADMDKNVLKMPSVKIMFEALTPRLAGEIVDSERLELLGDSLLKLVSSVEVFRHFPTKHEGFLTSQRAKTINNLFLMETCYRLRIHKYLRAFSLSNGKQQLKVRPPGMEGWKAKQENRQMWNLNLWVQRSLGDEMVSAASKATKGEPSSYSSADTDGDLDSDTAMMKSSQRITGIAPSLMRADGDAACDDGNPSDKLNQLHAHGDGVEIFSSSREYFHKLYYPNPLYEVAFVKPKIIADMVEALIGAFYVAGGELGGIAAVRALGAWPQIESSQGDQHNEQGGSSTANKQVEQGLSAKLSRNRISLEFVEQDEHLVFPPNYPKPLKRVALGALRRAEEEKEEGEEEEDIISELDRLKSPEIYATEPNNNEAIELLQEYARLYQSSPVIPPTSSNGEQKRSGIQRTRFGLNRSEEEVIPAMEKMLGYRFKNWKILEEALTHCSRPDRSSNQRLEFLGDAVLDFAVVSLLFELLPWAQPGELASFKTAATNNRNLGLIGAKLQIYRYLRFASPHLEAEIEELDEVIEKWLVREQSSISTDIYSHTSMIDPAPNNDGASKIIDTCLASSSRVVFDDMTSNPDEVTHTIPQLLASLESSAVCGNESCVDEGGGGKLEIENMLKEESQCDDSKIVEPGKLHNASPFPIYEQQESMTARSENLDEVIMDSLVKRSSSNNNGTPSTVTGNKEKKLSSRMINSASKSIADMFEALIGAVYLDCHCSMDEIRKIVLHINLVPQLNELHEAKLKGLNFALGDRGFVR